MTSKGSFPAYLNKASIAINNTIHLSRANHFLCSGSAFFISIPSFDTTISLTNLIAKPGLPLAF